MSAVLGLAPLPPEKNPLCRQCGWLSSGPRRAGRGPPLLAALAALGLKGVERAVVIRLPVPSPLRLGGSSAHTRQRGHGYHIPTMESSFARRLRLALPLVFGYHSFPRYHITNCVACLEWFAKPPPLRPQSSDVAWSAPTAPRQTAMLPTFLAAYAIHAMKSTLSAAAQALASRPERVPLVAWLQLPPQVAQLRAGCRCSCSCRCHGGHWGRGNCGDCGRRQRPGSGGRWCRWFPRHRRCCCHCLLAPWCCPRLLRDGAAGTKPVVGAAATGAVIGAAREHTQVCF